MKKLCLLSTLFFMFALPLHAAKKMEVHTKTQDHSLQQAVQDSISTTIDEPKLIEQIRQALSVPTSWEVKISSLTPSVYHDFYQALVVFQQGPNRREQSIFITTDGEYFIIGNLYKMSTDYDALRREKIDIHNAFLKGKPHAPVTIVEYSDPQCPACKKANQFLNTEKILKDYDGKLNWAVKHIPIVPSHDWAGPASAACLCAGEQDPDKFWQMQNFFFDQQSQISLKNVTEQSMTMAQTLHLDLTKFKSCYESNRVVEKIKANMQEAENVGIVMTPSFVVNGRLINGGVSEQELRAMIDQFLNNSK